MPTLVNIHTSRKGTFTLQPAHTFTCLFHHHNSLSSVVNCTSTICCTISYTVGYTASGTTLVLPTALPSDVQLPPSKHTPAKCFAGDELTFSRYTRDTLITSTILPCTKDLSYQALHQRPVLSGTPIKYLSHQAVTIGLLLLEVIAPLAMALLEGRHTITNINS